MTDYLSNLAADIQDHIIELLDPPSVIALYQVSQYFHEKLTDRHSQIMEICDNDKSLNDKFRDACFGGHLFIAKWLCQSVHPLLQRKSSLFDHLIIVGCCDQNVNKKMIRWMIDQEIAMYPFLFASICGSKSLEMAQYALEINPSIDIHMREDFAFKNACWNNRLDIAKWLFEMGDINIHMNKYELFSNACLSNKLDMVNWFIEVSHKSGTRFNLADMCVDNLFTVVCKRTHLNIAQILVKLCEDHEYMINIHINNDYAFYNACVMGELQMAKWLWELSKSKCSKTGRPYGIILRSMNTYMFSCNETRKWLESIW